MAFLAPVLAELVSCGDIALTGAPREGFCQAPPPHFIASITLNSAFIKIIFTNEFIIISFKIIFKIVPIIFIIIRYIIRFTKRIFMFHCY
jgi:hypothetical protein